MNRSWSRSISTPETPNKSREPKRIGPYLIERKLGSGGMGTVYLGRHTENGTLAAIKVLSSSLANEEGLVARFNREIDAMKKLSNPHIVQFYESGVDGNIYYYAMEYVEGETVAERLRSEKRIGWETVIDISVQVCVALKSAHDAGIIHRDLKPSNLLITPDNQIKLADFGIAQIFAGQRLTMTGGVVGTAEFMSPEQAQGQRATKASDLYSLGAVMYAMLTGRPPFMGKTAVEVLQKHRFNQFDPPRLILPDIPVWLDDVVCQLMEKDPDKRYPDAYVLSLRLKEIPKKVEIAGMQETRTADPAAYNSDATTMGAAGMFRGGPGDGTLMRDLLRAEIERQHQPSRVGRLFDNTWFLVALLVALLAGGYFWSQSGERSPEEKFAAGEQLMQQPAGDGWVTARSQFFQPLLELDPSTWEPRVREYLEQIKQYELEKRLTVGTLKRNRDPATNDAERFLRMAQHYREIGDTGRAHQILTALDSLLDGHDEFRVYGEQAKKMLAELDAKPTTADDPHQLLKAALHRAEQLEDAGQQKEARAIYSSIIALYEADSAATNEVQTAKQHRAELSEPPPTTDDL